MSQIMITLQQILDARPDFERFEPILRAQGGKAADYNKPFPVSSIVKLNESYDTLWFLRCLPEHNNLWRMFAVGCARDVQHLMTDQRSIEGLNVAEMYAHGDATESEFDTARNSVYDAAKSADFDDDEAEFFLSPKDLCIKNASRSAAYASLEALTYFSYESVYNVFYAINAIGFSARAKNNAGGISDSACNSAQNRFSAKLWSILDNGNYVD